MYTKEQFIKTISVLVRAFMDETLVHGHPCGCAVGNLLADKLGIKVVRVNNECAFWDSDDHNGHDWFSAVYPERHTNGKRELGLLQISVLGYTMQDIISIERAFESPQAMTKLSVNPNIDYDYDGYNGLMAVVDVLCDIHGMNEEEKKEAKELFVKY